MPPAAERKSERASARKPVRRATSKAARKPAFVPDLSFERQLRDEGCRAIAGVDEVGRGPLAGPVVAAAVTLPHIEGAPEGDLAWIADLRDSKQLSQDRREALAECIQNYAISAVAAVSPQVIDQVNILQATRLAMRRAVDALPATADGAIIDGRERIDGALRQVSVISGDARCASVAAASILAKVTRDRIMQELDLQFPGYGLAVNKGYGTAQHMSALRQLGYTSIHRLSFAPVRAMVDIMDVRVEARTV